MQASTTWRPPAGTLGEILAETRKRVASLDRLPPRPVGQRSNRAPSLAGALRQAGVSVIAEVKRRSPSRGELDSKMDAGAQAERFERGGAAAVSVLTEPSRFGGSIDDLREVRRRTRLPMLRKDFHIAPGQIDEAVAHGASGVLLIARALPPADLIALARHAAGAGIDALVEVRSEAELETALASGAPMIGVNSRNLETLEVDERIPERLIPLVPSEIVAVWESGVSSVEDVRRAARAGADAVLVGSALSLSAEPERLLRSLTGIARSARG